MSNIIYNDNGTVWKKHKDHSSYKTVFPILEKYKLNFIPKILEWDDEGYKYKYIDEMILEDYQIGIKDSHARMKMILEVKMAMDDIWKKLYQISIENLEVGCFLWYDDPNLANLIWLDDNKKLILLDIDSFCIGNYVPISYINNIMIQQLETNMIRETWTKKF